MNRNRQLLYPTLEEALAQPTGLKHEGSRLSSDQQKRLSKHVLSLI